MDMIQSRGVRVDFLYSIWFDYHRSTDDIQTTRNQYRDMHGYTYIYMHMTKLYVCTR